VTGAEYLKGRNFENYVKRKLESKGFLVIRAAGSKGVFDLVAFPPERRNNVVLGIQCKAHGKMSNEKKQEMIRVADKYNLLPVLATKFNNRVILVNLETGTLLEGL